MGRNFVQFIGNIIRVQGGWQNILVIVKEKFPGLNAAGRIAHDGDIVGVNSVDAGVFANKPYGPGHIQCAFFLGVGPQAVIDDKGLISQLPQMGGSGQRVGIVAAHLKGPARQQHHGAFYLCPLPQRDGGEIGAEIYGVKVGCGYLGLCRKISLFPQV